MTITQASAVEKLDRAIRARYPIVGVISHEEKRVLASIEAVGSRLGRITATWALTTGWENCPGVEPETTRDPVPALEAVMSRAHEQAPILFVMKDLHPHLNDPLIIRWLRDIAQRSKAPGIPSCCSARRSPFRLTLKRQSLFTIGPCRTKTSSRRSWKSAKVNCPTGSRCG